MARHENNEREPAALSNATISSRYVLPDRERAPSFATRKGAHRAPRGLRRWSVRIVRKRRNR